MEPATEAHTERMKEQERTYESLRKHFAEKYKSTEDPDEKAKFKRLYDTVVSFSAEMSEVVTHSLHVNDNAMELSETVNRSEESIENAQKKLPVDKTDGGNNQDGIIFTRNTVHERNNDAIDFLNDSWDVFKEKMKHRKLEYAGFVVALAALGLGLGLGLKQYFDAKETVKTLDEMKEESDKQEERKHGYNQVMRLNGPVTDAGNIGAQTIGMFQSNTTLVAYWTRINGNGRLYSRSFPSTSVSVITVMLPTTGVSPDKTLIEKIEFQYDILEVRTIMSINKVPVRVGSTTDQVQLPLGTLGMFNNGDSKQLICYWIKERTIQSKALSLDMDTVKAILPLLPALGKTTSEESLVEKIKDAYGIKEYEYLLKLTAAPEATLLPANALGVVQTPTELTVYWLSESKIDSLQYPTTDPLIQLILPMLPTTGMSANQDLMDMIKQKYFPPTRAPHTNLLVRNDANFETIAESKNVSTGTSSSSSASAEEQQKIEDNARQWSNALSCYMLLREKLEGKSVNSDVFWKQFSAQADENDIANQSLALGIIQSSLANSKQVQDYPTIDPDDVTDLCDQLFKGYQNEEKIATIYIEATKLQYNGEPIPMFYCAILLQVVLERIQHDLFVRNDKPISIRSLAREFIVDTKIDKKEYAEKFIHEKFKQFPKQPYTSNTATAALDNQLNIWRIGVDGAVQHLVHDSNLIVDNAVAPPLLPVTSSMESLPKEMIHNMSFYYPLINHERVIHEEFLFLTHDWQGLSRGTCFYLRKTHVSTVYFALPDVKWNLQTDKLVDSHLFGIPINEEAKTEILKMNYMVTASASISLTDNEATILEAGYVTMDVIGTLSWATPAGPVVNAVMTIIKAIVGSYIDQPSTLEQMMQVGKNIVQSIQDLMENRDIKEYTDLLFLVPNWLKNISILTDSTDRETLRFHLLEPNGIWAQLNKHIYSSTDGKQNLFGLVYSLFEDSSFKEGDPYDTPHKWYMVKSKLSLLFYAGSLYFLAWKIKIVLVDRLYQAGYDVTGKDITGLNVINPDNDLSAMLNFLKEFTTKTAQITKNIRARRMAAIILEHNPCQVAYTTLGKPVSQRSQWNLGEHNALYTGPKYDQMVRDKRDNPPAPEYTFSGGPEHPVRLHVGGPMSGDTIEKIVPREVLFYDWYATEVIDRTFPKDESCKNFVLDNCAWGGWNWQQNMDRVTVLKERYVQAIGTEVDEWIQKMPKLLETNLNTFIIRWTPQLPEDLRGVGVKLVLDPERSKDSKIDEDPIWSDPSISVRYSFCLLSSASSKQSQRSDDPQNLYSTPWTDVSKLNVKHAPKVCGLPTKGKYLDYVSRVCLFRCFRQHQKQIQPDGTWYKVAHDREIKRIERISNTNEFPSEWDDVTRISDKDKELFGIK